ncbi:MAG TPA: bifunctional phosphoribosyl-AMP cyclohydrolase/phosphoribosyl-ATP diphosphatase HisIE [Deinococcales bacterium]|nr:bifunctional phosphoribosyl-AMP cyclohydrolase/phosphoribosyl-ATP diphosphatase HisIE [Deinococcales bacterium]
MNVQFDSAGLVPVVAQDAADGTVLMLAYANREALEKTLETGRAHYWSRSRGELWEKGATSGHTQKVVSLALDCDGDAVVYRVEQTGPACHTGERSCFFTPLTGEAVAGANSAPARSAIGPALDMVFGTILERIEKQPEGSYVAKLHNQGLDRVLKKIGEEAGETIIAAKNRDRNELTLEASDLFFHTLFTLAEVGVTLDDIAGELRRRHAAKPRE